MKSSVAFEFVKYIPDELEGGILCISLEFATASHKCCCGCGGKVVTPLSPSDWAVLFDGDTVSLYPSIGNWSFECRSHYWIYKNSIVWADDWTDDEIQENRAEDLRQKREYFLKRKNRHSISHSCRTLYTRFFR